MDKRKQPEDGEQTPDVPTSKKSRTDAATVCFRSLFKGDRTGSVLDRGKDRYGRCRTNFRTADADADYTSPISAFDSEPSISSPRRDCSADARERSASRLILRRQDAACGAARFDPREPANGRKDARDTSSRRC